MVYDPQSQVATGDGRTHRLQHQRQHRKYTNFLGSPNLPQITVSPVILDKLEEPAGPLHKADMDFFAYMEDAMTIPLSEESSVDDFAAFVSQDDEP